MLLVVVTGCAVASADTPGAGISQSVTCTGGAAAGWSAEQTGNARIIAQVAMGLGLGQQGALVGITTAITEATLINAGHGDTAGPDSTGLFQQRAPWGPRADRMDPARSATMFYSGGQGGQPGLTDIPGWQSMTVPAAAQAVQGSQFGNGSNYAGNLDAATTLTATITAACKAAPPPAGSGTGGAIVAAARAQLGMPYVWGGGGSAGPSGTDVVDGRGPGFDCSGLVQYAVYTGTDGAVTLPRTAAEQAGAGTAVPPVLARMQPGDLIAFDNGDRVHGADHIGIYIGNGQMIDAPESTQNVQVDQVDTGFYATTAQWSVRRITEGNATP